MKGGTLEQFQHQRAELNGFGSGSEEDGKALGDQRAKTISSGKLFLGHFRKRKTQGTEGMFAVEVSPESAVAIVLKDITGAQSHKGGASTAAETFPSASAAFLYNILSLVHPFPCAGVGGMVDEFFGTKGEGIAYFGDGIFQDGAVVGFPAGGDEEHGTEGAPVVFGFFAVGNEARERGSHTGIGFGAGGCLENQPAEYGLPLLGIRCDFIPVGARCMGAVEVDEPQERDFFCITQGQKFLYLGNRNFGKGGGDG
jgi:hypothetical protein